jgi:uncharacterized protein YjbJ (UPF0337 family)
MNKDRAMGTIDEMVGSAKRKAGDLTGNTKLQVEGMVQQAKGKVENLWGKAKEAVHDANKEAAVKHQTRVAVELECAEEQPESQKTK